MSMLWRSLSLGVVLAAAHCTLIADADLGAGLGKPCSTNGDCQASICERGICTLRCTGDAECAAPSLCFDGFCGAGCKVDTQCPAQQTCIDRACKVTTRVAALLPGAIGGEDGWSTSHKQGLDEATTKYAPVLRFGNDRYVVRTSVRRAPELSSNIDDVAEKGAQVVFTASEIGTQEALEAAQRHPNVKFIAMGAEAHGAFANVGAYSARAEPGWFAAGRLAARVAGSGKKCIGLVLPNVSRQIVRETNAFARGARTQQPDIKVVVRWLGDKKDGAAGPAYPYKAQNFAFDSAVDGLLFREELLAAQIFDLGCTLVGHRTETQRVVSFHEKRLKVPIKNGVFKHDAFTMGMDFKDACRDNFNSDGTWLPSCLGVPYWNWAALYDKILDEILRGVWKGISHVEPFRSDAAATFKYELSPFPNITTIGRDDGHRYIIDAANLGIEGVFRGPYAFNGQRDLDRNGTPDAKQSLGAAEGVLAEELARMCWFVDGVFELPSPTVVDYTQLVPALVPYGPAVAGQATTLDEADPAAVQKYGDVIQFLKASGEDPTRKMSCPLN